MRRPPPPSNDDDADGPDSWLVTYSDMVTLLMAFFVLLMSISKVDMVLFEQMKSGMAKDIGKREVQSTVDTLRTTISEEIKAVQLDDQMSIGQDSEGLNITFGSGAFFGPGSAEVKEEAIPAIEKIAATLNTPRYEGFMIEVEGHTDPEPINTPRFPSNWELSALRATGVVRALEAQGIQPWRIKALGFAQYKPRVANYGPVGPDGQRMPLKANMELNRRIVFHLVPISQKEIQAGRQQFQAATGAQGGGGGEAAQ